MAAAFMVAAAFVVAVPSMVAPVAGTVALPIGMAAGTAAIGIEVVGGGVGAGRPQSALVSVTVPVTTVPGITDMTIRTMAVAIAECTSTPAMAGGGAGFGRVDRFGSIRGAR